MSMLMTSDRDIPISATPPVPQHLRRALKRGLARAAVDMAAKDQARIPALLEATHDLAPNTKALVRNLNRLSVARGVVRAVLSADRRGLVLIARNHRQMITRAEGTDVFAAPEVVYTRLSILPARGGALVGTMRASFCAHAIERLVERTDLPLDRPLLPALDAEASALLGRITRDAMFEDADDHFIPATAPGVWAGSPDRSQHEDEWGLVPLSGPPAVLVFSVRTFLGPDQMRPMLWLHWNKGRAG